MSVNTHPEVVTPDSDEDAIPPSPAISRRSSRIQPKSASWASWPTKSYWNSWNKKASQWKSACRGRMPCSLPRQRWGNISTLQRSLRMPPPLAPLLRHHLNPAKSALVGLLLLARASERGKLPAKSVQSLGARMDAVETPGGTPGRVQAPNPLSSAGTAPFFLQQPSGSVPSAFTGYAPGTCLATMATAAPALAPVTYSLSTALPAQLQVFVGTRTRNPPAPAAKGRQTKGGAISPRDSKISPIYPNQHCFSSIIPFISPRPRFR
ncbi:unnamed protein product [Arctogadus glacialis]